MLAHRLALRNLLRHRRRSLLTAGVIVLTMALLTCFQGLSDGGHRAMIEVGVRMGLGHLILSQSGHVQDPGLSRLLPGDPATLEAARSAAGPSVEALAPRLRLSAMAQAGSQQVAVTASGVDAAIEQAVSGIADARALRTGVTLEAALSERPATALPPIVIGSRLARALDVQLGDRVTLTVKPREGEGFARAAFELVGIFHTGMQELDAFWVEVPLPAAQGLAGVGPAVSHVAVYLRDQEELGTVKAGMQAFLQARDWEAQRWMEAAPELHSAVALDAAGMWLLKVIVVVVVIAGVLNTVIMSVLQRQREFGVMLALGCSPVLVVRVVLLEALYLASASLVAGLALGLALHGHFATEGLNFREVFGTGFEAAGVLLPERFFSVLDPLKLATVALLVLLLTLAVSAYPAIRSARLNPIDAIRHHD